jgi:glycosyltransferase involved in cell wall biosynthesis
MRIAFYYHITIHKDQDKLYLPGYLGVFIDSLAQKVDQLYLVMHKASSAEIKGADYQLKGVNIVWINLGFKTPVWHRAIFNRKILKTALKQVESCCALIVRGPSPLAPYFGRYIKHPVLVYMVVGDYLESVEQWKLKNIREWFELQYLRYNDYVFRKAMRTTDVMVNSPALFYKYKRIAKSIYQIKTTTLSTDDFFERVDTCQNDRIELLFTGRIDPLKGLFELINALFILLNDNVNVRLNIVGWEQEQDRPIEKALMDLIAKFGIQEYVKFHGKKSIGEELNRFYRMADIYILPSHEEGFPRTIWEAMANSLPVITTNVGGIPSYLTDNENALMINPKSVDLIVEAVKRIITDAELRRRLILNGQRIAKENTLEIQTGRMIKIIMSLINEQVI